MVKAVRSSYKDVGNYYDLKRKLLKLKKLYDYDRYAPTFGKSSSIPFLKAKDWVIEAFKEFDSEFGKIAKLFFTKKWIDAQKREGKRGGAFCSFCTPDIHPYVFMNYNGSMRDVFTLMHELGHGIHAYLMGEQSYLSFDTPLTIAETASVFAEQNLFHYLVERAKTPKSRLNLYLQQIESVIATTHRQTSMFLFERDLHSEVGSSGELSTERINQIWRNRQEEMFKDSVELTSEYDLWWSYIPHFIHTPFYVYAYSFGQLLALGFDEMNAVDNRKFAGKYRGFLSAGNSLSPKELLKPFNVDVDKADIWKKGVKTFRGMVKEAENLASKI